MQYLISYVIIIIIHLTWTTLPETKISFVLRSVRKQVHLVLDSKLLNIPFFFSFILQKNNCHSFKSLVRYYHVLSCSLVLFVKTTYEHYFLSHRHKLKFSDQVIPACRAIQNDLRNDLK